LFCGARLLLGVVFGHFVVSWMTGFPTWSFWIIFKLELHQRAMTDLLTAWAERLTNWPWTIEIPLFYSQCYAWLHLE
jgi:hypothetical protein